MNSQQRVKEVVLVLLELVDLPRGDNDRFEVDKLLQEEVALAKVDHATRCRRAFGRRVARPGASIDWDNPDVNRDITIVFATYCRHMK